MTLPDSRFNEIGTETTPPLVNVGCGKDLTIRELAETIATVVGFPGNLRFDTAKPDGTSQKLLDIGRIVSLGWQPRTELIEGIRLSYRDVLQNHCPPTA